MKAIKFGLLPRIITAIIFGILLGTITPDWITRTCLTFNSIFNQFLSFLVPLIILGFVAPAIADIGKSAGRMLITTAILAYGFTILAGGLSYIAGSGLFPSIIEKTAELSVAESSDGLKPYFNVEIPSLMPVMTALVSAFTFGLGIAYLKSDILKRGFDEFRDIVSMVIRRVIIPLLPFYIFGIFLNMTSAGQVWPILNTFARIILIIFVLHVFILLLQFCIAALCTRRNPLRLLWTMMPAYFTALGTQSSAATIPVTLRQTISMGVTEEIAGFVVPLCATIHMSGSTLKIVACALALMIMQGHPYDAGMFMGFISMLAVTIIAAPGVPGGAIMASLGLLSSMLGFTEADNAMMIALYIAMDSFGTACNVTGDGSIALIVGRIFRKKPAATAVQA